MVWLPCNGRIQNTNNDALFWKIAVLGMERPPVGAGTSCSSPMLYFNIPPCRKTFTALRNIKRQHGRGKKCSRTNRGLFHFQNCNFSKESFILISFSYSARVWIGFQISDDDHSVKLEELSGHLRKIYRNFTGSDTEIFFLMLPNFDQIISNNAI